jgi:hypothetical protein
VVKCGNPGVFVSETTIKWEQPVRLPNTDTHDVLFEIADAHQFGYNPEELDSVFHGSLPPNPQPAKGNLEVLSVEGTTVGTLHFDCVKQSKSAMKPGSDSRVIAEITST